MKEFAPTRLLLALRAVATALDERGTPWALVGGLAVSIRAEPRFTRDIDIAVAVRNDAGAEALVADLVAGGFGLMLSLEQRALQRLATVRLSPPGETNEGVVVDLLFASTGIEADICREADVLEIVPGLVVPVATAGHLVAMKVLSLSQQRPQDLTDLRALLAGMDDTDRVRARQAVKRIEQIGAHRGKSLGAELNRHLDGR